MELYLNGGASFVEQRRIRIQAIMENELNDSECDQLFERYLDRYVAAWSLYDDVLPFLEKHADEIVGVISDGNHTQQQQKLEVTGISGFFRHVFTRESLGISKRSPHAYLAVCEYLGIEPVQMSYIGDNLETDVVVTGSLGIRSFWLNRFGHPVPPGITSIASLSEYVADL
jgi:putative hydrolase of the HAD superfamily